MEAHQTKMQVEKDSISGDKAAIRLDKWNQSMHNAYMSDGQQQYDKHRHDTQSSSTATMCLVKSYAKINLTLDILGKRSDGYHELASIMQMIDLYDTLCLTHTTEKRVSIVSTQPELDNESNLAVRAVQALRQKCSLDEGVHIELDKRIPVAAGLGGGSSNAAAVLLTLRQWWHLQVTDEELLAIAASLGSDVPFFLTQGLAFCEGRGERLTPMPPFLPKSMRWLLLLKPAISISTATVFRNLPASDYTTGEATKTLYSALLEKREPHLENLHNSLERGVLERYPEVSHARGAMLEAGAPLVRLSGSGPTLFALFSDLAHASRVHRRLHEQGYQVYLTCAVYPNSGSVCIL